MNKKLKLLIGVSVIAVVSQFASSCSVRQEVSLQIGGSGSSRLSVELHPVFTKYYSDLASGFSSSFNPKNPVYFNLDGIRENFASNPGLQLVSLNSPEPHKLELQFRFPDIRAAIQTGDPQIQKVISLSRDGDREILKIYLDRENLDSVLKMTSDGDSPPIKMLLPPEKKAISAEEYLDHLVWALEEYAGDENIETILRSAAVSLTIRVQGKIVSQKGGVLKGDSEAAFTLPLLKLLTLETPVEFSLTYTR
jgi:hypothetical protein